MSSDNGNSWSPVAGNLEQNENGSGDGPAVNWVSIVNVSGKKLYIAGTSTGLYSTSFINGKYTVWTQESPELIGNSVVHMLDVRQSDRSVAVATHGLGAFTANINSVYSLPDKPELVYPANDTGGVMNNVLFKWKPVVGAVFYKIELSTQEDFSIITQSFEGLKETQAYINIPIELQTIYYWRVVTINSGGISEPSETRNFITAAPPPVLNFPEHTATDIPTDTELAWSFQPCCTSYHVQLSSSLSFGSGMIADTVVSSSPLSIIGLEPNKRYYWRVASIDSWGEGPYSKTNNFRTKGSSGIVTQSNSKIEIYPMPIKETMQLNFSIDNPGLCSIFLVSFDLKIRKQLFNGYLETQSNSMKFDVSGLFPGFYTLIISTSKNIQTKSIIVN
jgi:hypothetical protein